MSGVTSVVVTKTLLFAVLFAILLPITASALSFRSDFTDAEIDWLFEPGSTITQNANSLTLEAATVSPLQRGRILIRPILEATPDDILELVFTLDISVVDAPFAARVFYYDAEQNVLGSEPLFGTLSPGRVEVTGAILSPGIDVAGFRVRLYANAPSGIVIFENFTIEGPPAIPEPGSVVTIGLGLIALSYRRSRHA